MNDATVDEALIDNDRLPWLETVEDDYEEGPPAWRVALYIALGLVALAAVIFGWFWLQNNRGADGNGQLIAAQEGDYKVQPNDPGGMKADGDGDRVFSASAGDQTNSSVDLSAVPEAPVTGVPAPTVSAKPGIGAARVVATVPSSSSPLSPVAVKTAPPAAAGGGGAVVQVGSFGSVSEANAAWSRLSKRFTYIAPLGQSVQQAEVNGRTVQRLRVNAGSAGQAKDLCAKLTLAGEGCFVVPN